MNALGGRRIVVTRPPDKADTLCARLEAAGAAVIRRPAIDVAAVEGDDVSDAPLRAIRSFDWVVFTSTAGVTHGLARLETLDVAANAFDNVCVAAVGPATATALRTAGIRVDAVPAIHVGARIADVVGPIAGRRFLLLRGDIASPALPERLRAAGGHVDEVIVYATVPIAPDRRDDRTLRDADAVTFTSPSTVRGFLEAIGDDAAAVFRHAAIISIGPVTSDEVRACGLTVAAEAEPHTIDGLVAALVEHFSRGAEAAR